LITIDIERCTGCGACLETCPAGALYLVDGKAAVDEALCRECEVCLDACPEQAIALTEQRVPRPEPARQLARRPEPDVIRVRTRPAPVPLRTRVLPVVSAALAWAGREIVPRLADTLLDAIDRRQTGRQTAVTTTGRSTGSLSQGQGKQGQGRQGGQGRRHRHRRRGAG
jgi:NAD-dependent dihydropyrimidine dehydrogenase PreA subunit